MNEHTRNIIAIAYLAIMFAIDVYHLLRNPAKYRLNAYELAKAMLWPYYLVKYIVRKIWK